MPPGLGEASPAVPPPGTTPSAEANDLRSPKLEGANVGEGLKGGIGDGSLPPEPMGEGGFVARVDMGECGGLEGREGPAPVDNGECRSDGDGEWSDGDPEDSVDDLNG